MQRIMTILALMTLPALSANAQIAAPAAASAPVANTTPTMEFKDLLYNNSTTLSLKLKDLNSDWRRITVGTPDSGGAGILGSLFGGGKGTIYYTKGQAVSIAGETYIVAYKANLKQMDFMSLIMASAASGGKQPDMSKMMPEKLTPDSVLSLSLLNLRVSGNLSDIRPFDMTQEIADSGNAGGGLTDLMMLGMMADQNKSKGAGASGTTSGKKKP